MKNKLSYSPLPPLRSSKHWLTVLLLGFVLSAPKLAMASGEAPQWVHLAARLPLAPHDEKTDAVLLYSERNVTVVSADKIRRRTRAVYKILRPGGRQYGTVEVYFHSPGQRVISLQGWSIPAQGRDFEVKEKDAVEVSPPAIDGSELVSDLKVKLLRIPASEPGNIIGYEYEVEERPLLLQDDWFFQDGPPVSECHLSLQLPPSWEYKSSWINYEEAKPLPGSGNVWNWTLKNVVGIEKEEQMPPLGGIAGHMMVTYFPPGEPTLRNELSDWRGTGLWYAGLTIDRTDASPEMKQKVLSLTAAFPSPLEKMKAIAKFVQHDIRYVAIELGIGGFQPHSASEVFTHRYGDCKDKATLMVSMLREIGVEAYYVVINSERGSVTAETPANLRNFDHVVVAIKLPKEAVDVGLQATVKHPKWGTILFFDPTNEFTPFGEIGGYLQANYGLLVAPDGGELLELPKAPTIRNSITRSAQFKLDASGNLQGDVKEIRMGDRASDERSVLNRTASSNDRIKPIERILAESLSAFRITKATITNMNSPEMPFAFQYSFNAEGYAKNAGDLLLVRVRALGNKSSALLETKEPRRFPIEFEGPSRDTDSFEISIPPGYEVEDLPPPIQANYSFASYHSRSELKGNVIHYNRTLEVKELSVPISKADELKALYRTIAGDERNTAVLKPIAK